MIMSSVRETVAEPYFLSILQHLLSIRDDIFARSVTCPRSPEKAAEIMCLVVVCERQ